MLRIEKKYKSTVSHLVFSKWSRKSYAIFASLSKVVKIAQLLVNTSLALSSKKQISFSLIDLLKVDNSSELLEFNNNPIFNELLLELLLELGIIKIQNQNHCYSNSNTYIV